MPPLRAEEPLAYRMSPRTLDEYVGQRAILGEGKMLRRMILADQLSSLLLFGPPGVGKTSLARLIAASTKRPFRQLNAVTAGVADIKRVIADATNPILNPEGQVLLFIDEIHRFNKAQQDALLPSVEDGTVVLIGATTENPFFTVNKALVSRSTVFQLQPLTAEEIGTIIDRAMQDSERGYGRLSLTLDEAARSFLEDSSQGDARVVLNALELAVKTTPAQADGSIHLSLEVMADCLQQSPLAYDRQGEGHYDTISAFIKSMRGSDPDAALHYLARMLEAGEDLDFICRRLTICAAEDVGLANPQVLSVCMAVWQTVRAVGMPEARIPLAEAVILVATSPKSNSAYKAIDAALADVRHRRIGEIPLYLRNAPISGMADLGYHEGYRYAHDFPMHVAAQRYLPEALADAHYYEAGSLGHEARIRQWMEMIEPYRKGTDQVPEK